MTKSPPHTNPVSTPHDLIELWTSLIGDGPFGRRTLWMCLLDEDGRPAPVLVPIDDVPAVPTTVDVTGLTSFVGHLTDLGTVVMLLSRPGPVVAQARDRRWARVLAPLAPRWPVHLASADSTGRSTIRPLNT